MYRVIAADLFTFMDILLYYGLTHQSGYHSYWHTLKFSGHYLPSYPGHNEWPGYKATYYTMATYYQD